jgi:hypothetical protein
MSARIGHSAVTVRFLVQRIVLCDDEHGRVSADFRAIGSTQRLGRVIVGVRTWMSMFGGWFGRWRVEMLSLACCGLAV